MPPWVLVSPASRGLGFALARKLLRSTPLPLVATARTDLDRTRDDILSAASTPAAQIGDEKSETNGEDDPYGMDRAATAEEEGRLTVLNVDVCDESTISAAASDCASLFPSDKSSPSHLHAAFILPGILHPEKSPADLTPDTLLSSFRVNAIGPALMMKHFTPFLPRKNAASLPLTTSHNNADTENQNKIILPTTHATFLSLSARVGSISDNNAQGGWYSYRASKAAVNQFTRTLDNYLRMRCGPAALAVAYHPGTVATDLSRRFWSGVPEGKLFSTGYAVEKLCEVVAGMDGRSEEFRGRCWDWSGVEVKP